MLLRNSLERLFRAKRLIVPLGITGIVIICAFSRSHQTFDLRMTLEESKTLVSEGKPLGPSTPSVPEEDTLPPDFFNSTYLLNEITKELETDGWVAPNGTVSDCIENRLRRMNAKSRSITATLSMDTESTESTEPVLLKADRWKVNYMGCFYATFRTKLRLLTRPMLMPPVTSATECIIRCDQHDRAYASIYAGSWCTCGESISRYIVLMASRKDELCDNTCKHESNRRRSCGGDQYASIYRIAIHRRQSLTLSEIHQSSAGCYKKPMNFEQSFAKKVVIANGTAAHCLIHCEKIFEPIASWDPQSWECMCGKYDVRLPLDGLTQSPKEEFCDNKYCKSTSTCNDRYITSMRTYADDKRCESKSFRPEFNSTMTALASFPGSGNTWVRHLIESAVGIYSGSIYNDTRLYKKGFLGEIVHPKSGRTSVIKTHEGSKRGASAFHAAVVLIRNPYDALMAEYNRAGSGGHVSHAKTEYFTIKEWDYFVYQQLSKWLSLIREFCNLKKVHVSFFEDIVANPIEEVKAISGFLGIPIPNLSERLQCLLTNKQGNFKRHRKNLGFDPFNRSMKKYINLFIQEARYILLERGVATLPEYERT